MAGVTTQRILQGRYRTEQLLASGGMGTVWRGRDLRLDRPVAIKELTGEGSRLPAALQRFEREARAVARLSHPNVVSVYDYGVHDGKPFLVMELVDGPTVAALLDHGPLPLPNVLAIASQTCDGLAVAHDAGIIHRDIKPANLILTPTGAVKICDFGVVRLLDTAEQAGLTGPAEAMGSPSYMAPEQITGGHVDARTDLYALGCTMYAMLAGHPPFCRGGPVGIVHQHLHETPEPLRTRRPEVPPEVEALVSELLAKAPDQRPSDAAAVRSRITAITEPPTPQVAPPPVPRAAVPTSAASAGVPPGAARTVPLPAPQAAVRRRWGRPVAAAALGAALLAAMIWAVLALRPPSGASSGSAVRPTSSSAATMTPSVAASYRPTTSPTATTSPAAPGSQTAAADPVVALRLAIGQQVNAGHLNPDTARDLNHMVDDLAKAIANDNPDDEAKKVKAMRDKLTSLYKDGKLSADGYRALNGQLDQVAAALQ